MICVYKKMGTDVLIRVYDIVDYVHTCTFQTIHDLFNCSYSLDEVPELSIFMKNPMKGIVFQSSRFDVFLRRHPEQLMIWVAWTSSDTLVQNKLEC